MDATVQLYGESGQCSRQLNALIIDDDEIYSHLLSRYLRQMDDMDISVDTCNSATKGIHGCLRKSYDILLIDYNLPDLNGVQLLHELRSRLNEPPPVSIILTSDGGESIAGQALRASAADYLPKRVVSVETLSRSLTNALVKHKLKVAVHTRNVELESVNIDLETKNREIQEFYQKVSHEVKTPLAAAREFIAIIRDELMGPINDEQAEILDHAIGSCDQIANHFNDLVEISRLDTGKISLTKKPVDVELILTRAIASCASALDSCQINVQQEIEIEDQNINVDADRMIQVFSNLIGNAIKFSENGSSIKIEIRSVYQDEIEVVVADTGCGISQADQGRIFNRLFQVSEASHQDLGCGLGLGLSIAREIVHLHGGKIWVKSETGVGSQFHFTVPHN